MRDRAPARLHKVRNLTQYNALLADIAAGDFAAGRASPATADAADRGDYRQLSDLMMTC
jgi:hypothetical protein